MATEQATKDSSETLDMDRLWVSKWFGRRFSREEIAAMSSPMRNTAAYLGILYEYGMRSSTIFCIPDRRRILGSVYFDRDESMSYMNALLRYDAMNLSKACRLLKEQLTPAELEMIVKAATK